MSEGIFAQRLPHVYESCHLTELELLSFYGCSVSYTHWWSAEGKVRRPEEDTKPVVEKSSAGIQNGVSWRESIAKPRKKRKAEPLWIRCGQWAFTPCQKLVSLRKGEDWGVYLAAKNPTETSCQSSERLGCNCESFPSRCALGESLHGASCRHGVAEARRWLRVRRKMATSTAVKRHLSEVDVCASATKKKALQDLRDEVGSYRRLTFASLGGGFRRWTADWS